MTTLDDLITILAERMEVRKPDLASLATELETLYQFTATDLKVAEDRKDKLRKLGDKLLFLAKADSWPMQHFTLQRVDATTTIGYKAADVQSWAAIEIQTILNSWHEEIDRIEEEIANEPEGDLDAFLGLFEVRITQIRKGLCGLDEVTRLHQEITAYLESISFFTGSTDRNAQHFAQILHSIQGDLRWDVVGRLLACRTVSTRSAYVNFQPKRGV